jgi:glycosyltransferase involved in cell wall biosynthesis
MQSDQTTLVSILVPTFNHALFVKDCLNGIKIQVCKFEFEIVVCDDGSTDGTVGVIKSFRDQTDLQIKTIFRKKNIGMNANVLDGLQNCNGKYIAICEGDDYWTDSLKLQRQVDFMEANSEFSICFHPVKIIDFTTGETVVSNLSTSDVTDIEHLSKGNYLHTASVLLRNQVHNYPDWMYNIAAPDYGLFMLNAAEGPIKMLSDTMAVYRKHDTGIWSQLKDLEMREKIVSYLLLMKDQFDSKTNKNLNERLEIILVSLVKEYNREAETMDKSQHYLEILAGQNRVLHRTVLDEIPSQKKGNLLNMKFLKRLKKG